MTPEQLAALVADLRNCSSPFPNDAADAIEHLQAEIARLSTPPDDADVAEIDGHLHDIINCGHCSGSRQSARKARAALTRLSHALASETAKREAMEDALQNVMGHVDTPIGRRRLHIGSPQPEWLTAARATLAKHGSKT